MGGGGRRPSHAAWDKPRLIIFVIGGATYSEFRVGHEVSAGSSSTCETEWDVVVGGSHVLAPQQFLQDLGYQEDTR